MTDLTERLQAWGDTDAEYGFHGRAQDLHLAATTIKTLTQENARLREAGWRDIESAPRDGTRFLAAWKQGHVSIVWWIGGGYTSFTDGSWDRCETPTQYGSGWFTHWMPLPPGPAKDGAAR